MKSIKVIKIGGKLIENEEVLASLCDELSSLGEAFVLVHGGGVMGSHLAGKLGVEVKMHEGRRITDAATLDIAVMAYAGLANKRVVAALQARGVDACGLSGCDMGVVVSHRRPDKAGVLLDVDDDSSLIARITPETYAALRAEQKIHSGMIPKIDNAYKTIGAGVRSVRITSPHDLSGGTVVTK